MIVKPPQGGFIYQEEPEWPGDVAVPDSYREARRAMIDADFLRSQKWQEQQWRALRIGAHREIVDFARYMIAKFKKLNIPLFASEMVRTHERQAALYADGLSNAQGAKAPHPFGCAVDIIHSIHGWTLTKKQWELMGELGKEVARQRGIAIVWGGDWPPIIDRVGWDPAHWQLKAWRQEMSGFPFMPPANERY